VDTDTENTEPAEGAEAAEPADSGDAEEHDEAGTSEEQDEHDVERLGAALAALDDDAVRHELAAMSAQSRQELATQLNLPAAASHLGDALPSLVRRKLAGATPQRQHAVASALTERTNSETIAALGDRSADPSRDDLLEVLPPILDEHGNQLVTLMLATYAASDASCRTVMRELLDTDERFAIGEPAPVPDAPPALGVLARTRDDSDPERAAIREQRKAAKAARKAANTHEREARANAEQKRRAAAHRSKRHT
jgi:hypothetical protein